MKTDVSQYTYKVVPAKQSGFAHVSWFHERNPRRLSNYGDGKHLVKPERLFIPTDDVLKRDIVDPFTAYGGWAADEPIICQLMTDEDIKESVRRRELALEILEQQAAETGDDACFRAIKHIWLDGRSNIIPSIWEGTRCYRRLSQVASWMGAILKANKGDLSALPTELPLMYPDTPSKRFLHDDHRIVVAMRENDKTKGFRQMSKFDTLRQLYHLIINGNRSTGWIEKNLNIKGSDRVFNYSWCRFLQFCEVERDWGLDLWSRIDPANQYLRDELGQILVENDVMVKNPHWIDMTRFKQMVWQGPTTDGHPYKDVAMGAMTDISKDLAEFNKSREGKKALVHRPDRDYVINWLNFFQTHSDANASHKIMTKPEIENLKGHGVKVGRLFAEAIYDRNNEKLMEAAQREFGYNFVHDVSGEVYPSLEEVLKEIKRRRLPDELQVQFWIQTLDLLATVKAEEVVS